MLHENFTIRKLEEFYQKKVFSCGVKILDDYIQKYASQDNKRHVAMTYVLLDEEKNKIAGYYTLSSTSIEFLNLSDLAKKNLPPYPLLPATLLGRLAIDIHYQHNNLGKHLLLDALKRALEVSQKIASFAVIVDAVDESAANFYKKYAFIPLINNRLYLPMKVIERIFI